MKVARDFADTDLFELNPAVRNPKNGCVDSQNCDYEKIELCAFNSSTNTKQRTSFLACMDGKNETTALLDGKFCANKVNLDFDSVNSCFVGPYGNALLQEASNVFNKRFPGFFAVPTVTVNNAIVFGNTYEAIRSALCKAGSTAKACKNSLIV